MPVDHKSPLRYALTLFWLLTAFLFAASLLRTGGRFGYPQDDAYIHMAIAKHLVNDGVWGATGFSFSSSTSSPLWTLLIALTYFLFGVNEYSPAVLSFLAGTGIVVLCHSALASRLDEFRLKLFLSAAVLFTPLAMLALSGMEHLLHALLTVGLLVNAVEYLAAAQNDWKKTAFLAALAALTTSIRYEGLFPVFLICVFLLLQKRIVQSALIGAAGLSPLAAYGLYSVSQGWLFLPNSILLKGNQILLPGEVPLWIFQRFADNILLAPHMLILLLACLWISIRGGKRGILPDEDRRLILLLGLTVFLHLFFAKVGWFFRYDAYLVLAGFLAAGRVASPLMDAANGSIRMEKVLKTAGGALVGILLILPFAIRAVASHSHYPPGVKNIHEQQYQMGLFVREYYNGDVVAANDIGAIGYLSDAKILDLYGLANLEVLQARRHDVYGMDVIRALVSREHVEIIVIYKSWFKGHIPPEWVEVGRWKITGNVACASDEVTFYVPDGRFKDAAIEHLREFGRSLPAEVIQSGEYLKP